MAEKVTEYTAKSQDFIDTDLFDVSKHVTQTSGVLVVGKRYTILDFNAGDNFTNVASVVSGTINTTGCVFDAIGTTPTTYSNGSTLARYETQSYTYEDLRNELNGGAQPKIYEALLNQTGTNAPTPTVLVNTLGSTPPWTYGAGGSYRFEIGNTIAPDLSKVVVYINNTYGEGYTFCAYTDTGLENRVSVYITNNSDVGTDNVLSNTSIIIKVYP